jgi:MoxR-like ATPase
LVSHGAVITVSGDVERQSSIPGMLYPTKVTLKGAGRGNTDVGGIVLPTTQFTVLEDAWHIAQQGKPAAVLLTGAAGTAKTMLVRAFAAYLGVGYLKVDAGAVRTADDWAGAFRQDPNTKTWAHRWSPLAQALREGKPCIIHIDELTRTETPAALNAFMGLLDETGTLLVPDANAVLTMPKGILVVATANIGPEFVGTLPLDGAVRQRFPYGVRMTNPTESVESTLLVKRTGISNDVAVALVRMANQQRQHRDDAQQYPSGAIVSTRILLSIAERIALRNTEPRDAVISTLQAQFDPGDDAALSVVIDAFFPKVAKPVAPTEASPANIVAERHWFVGPTGAACQKVLSDGTPCGNLLESAVHFGNK